MSPEQHTTELSAEAKNAIIRINGFFKKIRYSAKTVEANSEAPGPVVLTDEFLEFKQLLLVLIKDADFTVAFTHSGIPQGASFTDETLRIIKNKILPYLHSPKEAGTIIRSIFNHSGDHQRLVSLFATFKLLTDYFGEEEKKEILALFNVQLTNAVKIISYRIAALGMDEDVYVRAGKDDELITPFMEQNREVNELLINLQEGSAEKAAEDMGQIKVMIRQCRANIAVIDKAAESNGTSLHQTFVLRKLELLIERMEQILPIICCEDVESEFKNLSDLICHIILLETKPKKLRDFISRNIKLISYRITENKRKTGEHYISSTSAEYWELFLSACGGGLVVSFMVIIKLLAHEAGLPLLWEALLYSVIYATGFVVIQALHFTLATKQPAMTAAYIAASLDDMGDDRSRHEHFAATIAMVSRSQLVSFAGNLLVVFPLTLLWVFLISIAMHRSFIEPKAGQELLSAVHPAYSLSFLYASITGVFLFAAGIISGFGDNKVVVSKIGLRIENHPSLKKRISAKRLHGIASYLERNLGPLLGNIILGFMLGFAGLFGKITGLPFDIRHITFSTGNMAMGFYGVDFQITLGLLFACITGIFIIGLFNFVISFYLALQVAALSRGISLKDYPGLLKAVLRYFKHHPMHFFFPPKAQKNAF
ncbi:MAG: hypothetical protein JWO06_1920 [Bacteroidota bacterium]|nr:hypothetical protein [Bacteroidota bacterium]